MAPLTAVVRYLVVGWGLKYPWLSTAMVEAMSGAVIMAVTTVVAVSLAIVLSRALVIAMATAVAVAMAAVAKYCLQHQE